MISLSYTFSTIDGEGHPYGYGWTELDWVETSKAVTGAELDTLRVDDGYSHKDSGETLTVEKGKLYKMITSMDDGGENLGGFAFRGV